MLTATGLEKRYSASACPIVAATDVSVAIASGEFVALCGPSGSGKSTVLAMLAGLSRPTHGMVTLLGTNLYALSPGRRTDLCRQYIGIVPQFTGLLPTLCAIDNVAFPGMIGGGTDPYPRAAELLAAVGLGDRHDAYPAELSGGQQRRVAVARALINRPAIVLADEPTADLDPDSAGLVLGVLLELQRREGTALVVATHDSSVASHATRVLTMRGGRVVADEAVATIRNDHVSIAVPSQPTNTSASAGRFGSGIGRRVEQLIAALALGVGFVAASDYLVSAVQTRQTEAVRDASRELESVVLRGVRCDIESIRADADGQFTVALFLEPLTDDRIFLTAPVVRAFVQVDRDWVEVPCEAVDEISGVAELTDRRTVRANFRPVLPRFTQLIPGYQHVRFTTTLLAAHDPGGMGGLYERVDDYYIYLKPPGADDAAICQANGWTSAPLWIGMPAH